MERSDNSTAPVYEEPQDIRGQAIPLPPMSIGECVRSELRNTLNSRIFYLVAGVGIGLAVAILISGKKGNSLL